eukprot:7165814-Ditylum_brightwellii.AAC.1
MSREEREKEEDGAIGDKNATTFAKAFDSLSPNTPSSPFMVSAIYNVLAKTTPENASVRLRGFTASPRAFLVCINTAVGPRICPLFGLGQYRSDVFAWTGDVKKGTSKSPSSVFFQPSWLVKTGDVNVPTTDAFEELASSPALPPFV